MACVLNTQIGVFWHARIRCLKNNWNQGVAVATLRDLRASGQTADERHERGGDLVFGDDGCGARRNRFRAFRIQFVCSEDQNVGASIELPNLPHKAGCRSCQGFRDR